MRMRPRFAPNMWAAKIQPKTTPTRSGPKISEVSATVGERDYTCDTPDGRGRSRREAGARLARMVCADLETIGPDAVTAIAEAVARAQVRR